MTQGQAIWILQLCGLPQEKERCTQDVVSPERTGPQGTVCNDEHATDKRRESKQNLP